jgi:hypothetical protein
VSQSRTVGTDYEGNGHDVFDCNSSALGLKSIGSVSASVGLDWGFEGDNLVLSLDITVSIFYRLFNYTDYFLIFYYYGSTAICWVLAAFSVSWSYTQSVELLGRGISPPQGVYVHIKRHKQRINAHNTDIYALSGIRTHDPSVRVSENSSCLRPRGHCDRHRIELDDDCEYWERLGERQFRAV